MARIFGRKTRLTALLAITGLFCLACPEAEGTDSGGSSPRKDAGGNEDGSVVNTEGESCTNALAIADGDSLSNTTVGASDDISVDLDADNLGVGGGGADRVFTFTLTELSAVELTLSSADAVFDPALYILKSGCTATDLVEGAFADETVTPGEGESLSIAQLDAGTYFVVVDSWVFLPDYPATEGPFTLALNITPGGLCVADGIEENNTVETAAKLVTRNLDTTDLGDPDTPGPDPFPLNICGDDDFYVFPHMGGNATLSLSTVSGDGTLTGTLYNATYVTQGTDEIPVQGTEIGTTDFDGDIDRGYFLLHAAGTGVGALGLDYSMAVTHACIPDDNDDVEADKDDEVVTRSKYTLREPQDEAIARNICSSDKDAFVLQNVVAGTVVATVTNGANLGVTVGTVTGSGADTTVTPYTAVDSQANGDDLVVTMTDAPTGTYVHVIDSGSPASATTVEYTYNATFAGINTPPANDTCATAQVLTADSTTFGRTIGGSHTFVSSCNGDQDAIDLSLDGVPEVFYTLNIASQTNLHIDINGSEYEFKGSVMLLELPGNTCPADLTTLTAVQIDGADACKAGEQAKLRVTDIAAGDYLVVVDSHYTPEQELFGFIIPEMRTKGAFHLTTTLFPDGFPAPAACTAATEITVPASGATFTTDPVIDTTVLSNEIDDYGDCTTGGAGNEVVFFMTPTADAHVTITSSGYDTVLELREGACEGTTVICNDDNTPPGSLGSQVEADLVAGTTYYIIADGYGAGGGELTLTVATQ